MPDDQEYVGKSRIESTFKDEIIGTQGGGWKPGGSVKLIVSDTDNEKARFIVNEFEKYRDEEFEEQKGPDKS